MLSGDRYIGYWLIVLINCKIALFIRILELKVDIFSNKCSLIATMIDLCIIQHDIFFRLRHNNRMSTTPTQCQK